MSVYINHRHIYIHFMKVVMCSIQVIYNVHTVVATYRYDISLIAKINGLDFKNL